MATHVFCNGELEELHVGVQLQPAGKFEQPLDAQFAAAATLDGVASRRISYGTRRRSQPARLPLIPIWVQGAVLRLIGA